MAKNLITDLSYFERKVTDITTCIRKMEYSFVLRLGYVCAFASIVTRYIACAYACVARVNPTFVFAKIETEMENMCL